MSSDRHTAHVSRCAWIGKRFRQTYLLDVVAALDDLADQINGHVVTLRIAARMPTVGIST